MTNIFVAQVVFNHADSDNRPCTGIFGVVIRLHYFDVRVQCGRVPREFTGEFGEVVMTDTLCHREVFLLSVEG